MNLKNLLIIGILCFVQYACSADKNSTADLDPTLQTPSDISIERMGDAVTIRWTDSGDNENGFIISKRGINDDSYTEIGRVDKNVTEYTINSGLEENKSYYISVKAYSSAGESSSDAILFKYLSDSAIPSLSILSSKANSTYFSVSYQIKNADTDNNQYGLCWNADNTPTVNDQVQAGPTLSGDNAVQVIPNVLLEYGKSYKVRAYVVYGGITYYSSEIALSLDNEVSGIQLNWSKLSKSTLPSEVELYETTSSLNSRNFHAWYAIGDLSTGNVEVRVNIPSTATTIDDQSASFNGSCYLLVNGGYFYNGHHTGIAVINSVLTGTIPQVRGSLKSADDEYSVMYNVTRGTFGVNSSGSPAVYWAGSDTSGKTYFYDRPLPSVKGEAKYGTVSATNPIAPVSWSPKYAVSAGPVLLKDGKIPFDFSLTSKGSDYYMSNYEIIPYDIFGTDVEADRTAIGYRKDGKVVIFVCDGRISTSQGATLVELAQIMKGLGCIDAINLDGGGSTAMVVGSEHLNDDSTENRPVVSSIGFFKKE